MVKKSQVLRSWLIVLFYLMLKDSTFVFSQNLIISPGTQVSGKGGNVVIPGNLINNGSFTNENNTILFPVADQSVKGNFPVAFDNLTVESSSSTTVFTPGQTISGRLLCNGILNSDSNITLLSTEFGTALVEGSGTGQIHGNIIIQRYLPNGFGYKYLSSPFQSATVGEFADDIDLGSSNTAFYRYDENRNISGDPASGWVNYKITGNMLIPLAGYAVNLGSTKNPVTLDMKGIVNNGSLSVILYNNDNPYTTGYNLIGNPYPSPIDWDSPSGWTKTNIDNALYFFESDTIDQYEGSYITYINGISSNGLATNIIPSMQGFFVHVTDGSYPVTGLLALDNNVRVNDLTHSLIKKSDKKGTTNYLRLIAGYSDDTVSFDPLVIYFDENATYGFDSQYDALKLFNTDQNVTNFYSFGDDGSRLSINALPIPSTDTGIVRLGLRTTKNGDVIFRIKFISQDFKYDNIILRDVVTGQSKDLLVDRQYLVNLPAGDYQDRFFLNLSDKITAIPDVYPDNSWFNIYSANGILKADINLPSVKNGTLRVFNLLGEVQNIYRVYQPGHYEFSTGVKTGIYIVTFVSGNNAKAKKVFIQTQY